MQLGWIDNNQFAGEYMAQEQGYYQQTGLRSVTLIPGGSSATSAEAMVTSGKALLGVGDIFKTSSAVQNGGDLVVIGATDQKNPFALVSLDSKPLLTPQDLVGKKVAVPDTDTLVWTAFLKANNLNPSSVKTVPYNFDASVLTSGQVDGLLTYSTVGSPLLNSKGAHTQQFLLADHGLPLYGDPIVTSRANLKSHYAQIKAFMLATAKGWKWAINNPEKTNHIIDTKYAAAQHYDDPTQLIAMKAYIPLIKTAETKASGLLSLTPTLQAQNIALLATAGIKVSASQIFDDSVMQEIYKENAALLP